MLRHITLKTINFFQTTPEIEVLVRRYAGHSKWANIRHIKGLKDAQRSATFTRLGQQMKVAIRDGGSADPSKNLKLEQIIEQAKRVCMPAATIQSILKSTQTDKNQCKHHLIEIKGPGGCIILCEMFTDNLHHIKQNTLAPILRKHGFGDGGAKHWFEQKGIIETDIPEDYPKAEVEIAEQAITNAIEVGAEDVRVNEDSLEFHCNPNVFVKVQTSLQKLNHKILNANIDYTPTKLQTLTDDDLETCGNLYQKLEKMPEVVQLFDNIA